jgi:hypothetical protein
MANWRPVDVRVWNDRKFLAGGDDARLLWLFLLTCPSLPIPGVVVGGDAALAELLGWTPERLRERFHELLRNGLQVRRESRIVWLPNALKYQPPANPNMVKCWAGKWDDVPEGELKPELWEAIRIACKRWSVLFGKLFLKPLPEPLPEPFGDGSANGSRHKHQHKHEHKHQHDPEEKKLSPAGARAILQTPEQAPPPGESAWHRRTRWWAAMLEADARIRRAGIEQSAPLLAPAPAGENERNMHACEKQLLEAGFDAATVDAKMLHIVAVAEAEAMREQSRKWFKPALIWDPTRANRAVDTTIQEARRPRPVASRNGKQEPPAMPRPERLPPRPVIAPENLASVGDLAESWRLLGITKEST